jgi:hypothetical protein
MSDPDRVALLNDDEGLGQWAKDRATLLWGDIQAWSRYISAYLFSHWPLGPIKVYPPTESANFAVVNNEKTRLMAIARKKKEGAWRAALRWLCLMLLGVSVACLYQFIHGSINAIDEVYNRFFLFLCRLQWLYSL